MSSSPQSGPPNRPSSSSSSPVRRLRSPSERFGPPPPELQAPPLVQQRAEAEPIETETSGSSASRSRRGRHERHHFEREEHRFASRRAARRTVELRSQVHRASTSEPGAPLSSAKPAVPLEPSPTLLRIRETRKRFWRRVTFGFATLALTGAGAVALWAPSFNIQTVTITGLHATSPDLVRPIAARLIGHNVFRAPKWLIVQGVERLPTVAKARVVLRMGLPPRVVLQVHEREPIVRIGEGANWWVADADGMPYRPANARDAALPQLKWNEPIQTMKRFDSASWGDVLRLVEAVRTPQNKSLVLPRVREMSLDGSGDATLSLRKSPGTPDLIVRLGNDSWSEKLARARVALAYFERTKRDAGELNLISLKLPRWTPRSASASARERDTPSALEPRAG